MTPYDLIPYPSGVFGQTHPDWLGAAAALHGLAFAAPERARVLEIGCGDGLNLIALAVAWPQAQFEGFDLAASAVARGRAMVEALGLGNVRLEILDIEDAAPAGEAFDYVIAQGVYSWVAGPVRDALFGLIRQSLAPAGVAFVSYNALPGGYVRRMVRDMLLDGLTGVEDPRLRMERALVLLRSLADSPISDDLGRTVMQSLCLRLLDRPPEAFFHDELSDVYEPVYLKDFAVHAERHDLQFLGEADFELALDGFDDGALGAVAAAQIGDFTDVRYYRQSLLVRDDARPARHFDPETLRGLYASHRMREDRLRELAPFLDADPALERVHQRVLRAWPARVRLGDIPDVTPALSGIFELCVEGFLLLHAGPQPFVLDPGLRPWASPLVRLQLASGSAAVATLSPANLALPDENLRSFIALMDGSRSIAALASAAASLFDDGLTIDRRLEKLAGLALFPRWAIAG